MKTDILRDQIHGSRFPLEDVVEMRNGVLNGIREKYSPSYVLINAGHERRYLVCCPEYPWVTGFCWSRIKPVPLTEERNEAAGHQDEILRVEFRRGDTLL